VIGPIGAGAMGEVYRAQDHRLGREVAIKVLPVVFTADPDRVRRFEQEAKATGALNHPNILTIYDIGSDGGAPYVVSELLEGDTLRERLGRLLPIEAAVEFARQVAEGLAAAHAKGIVHRDLKPENLFVTRDDRIKILDFGLAKLMAGAGAAPGEGTQPGTVMGTAGYMAPEQVRGGHVDQRSDLFALGAILYEMLAGRRAFDALSPVETMHAIVAEQPVKVQEARPNVSDRLAAVVERALEKDPERRFQTARDLAAELHGIGARHAVQADGTRLRPGRSTSRRLAAAGAIGAIALAGLVLFQLRSPAIVERDSIVVGDIVNETGDGVFDGALKQALLIQLEPSPFSVDRVRIGGSPGAADDGPLGRRSPDRRRRAKRLPAGRREGDSHRIARRPGTAIRDQPERRRLSVGRCVRARTGGGRSQGNDRRGARACDDQAERQARRVAQFGAALRRSRRASDDLVARSAEEFQPGRIGAARGADGQAITFLNRALELDPNFPMAHIRLSSIFSTAAEFERAARHAKQAFDKKDLVGERERLAIEYGYYKRVTGEIDKAIAALEMFRQTYPRDADPSLNLSSIYAQTGDYEAAAKEALEAVRLKAPAAQATAALARARLALKQFGEARKFSETGSAATLSVAQRSFLYYLSFIDGDEATMQRQVASTAGTAGEPYVRVWHAHAAAARGQFRQSRDQFRQTVAASQRVGLQEFAATVEALEAIGEAAAGNEADARRSAHASVDRAFGRHSAGLAAVALALAGAVDDASALGDRLHETFPLDTLLNNVWLACARASIAASGGNQRRVWRS
jgi:tetratricopeptide (TPR) repeat protein